MKNKIFYSILISLLVFTTYLGLVVTDYVVFSVTRFQAIEATAKSREIATHRAKNEDLAQREMAIKRGFLPVFFPDAIRQNNYFRKLSEKLDVAPLGGQPYQNVYFCNEGYGLQTFKTDRFGFRNLDRIYDSDIDTLIIGDSFGAGACVDDEHTIQSVLTNRFSRPTISLSTGGASPIHYAAVSKTFIRKLQPKNVVLLFYSNDRVFGDELSYFNTYYFDQKKSKEYFSKQGTQSSPLQLSRELQNFYMEVNEYLLERADANTANIAHNDRYETGGFFDRLNKFLSLSHISHLLKLNVSAAPYSTNLAVDVTIQECAQVKCNVSVFFIPSSQEWDATPFSELYGEELYRATYGKTMFMHLGQVLDKIGKGAYAIRGGHLSPLGYSEVAKQIHYLSK